VGTANTISSLTALAANDVVEIVVYDVYNVAKINSEAMRNRWYFTATGGETSIGTSQISNLVFPANAEIDVKLNGVTLQAGTDYNTTTANTVGGLSALTAGQVVEIVYYEKFQLADTVSKAAGGTFGGDVTFDNNIKVDSIQNSSGTSAISVDSGGKVTFPNTLLQLGMADQFRLTASHTTNAGTITNWERPTDANGTNMLFAQLGTGMSVSSGVFTFPSTGYYVVHLSGEMYAASGDGFVAMYLQATEDNSTYNSVSVAAADGGSSGTNRGNGSMINFMNITDTANQKVRAIMASADSGSEVVGDADFNRTAISFVRIADAQ